MSAEAAKDPALQAALDAFAPPGIHVAHRIICDGDEDALLALEYEGLRQRAVRVRRQSGAARRAARELLAGYDLADAPLPRGATGAPVWPVGIVGSLSHDETVAVAGIAKADRYCALGIDAEPASPLPAGLVNVVATPRECATYASVVLESRLLFAVKEAIFKAFNPLDGVMLEFHDIEIDLDAKRGHTRQGQTIGIALIDVPRVVALAFKATSP